MVMHEENKSELIKALNSLEAQVREFNVTLDSAEILNKRTRGLVIAIAVLFILVGGGFGYYIYDNHKRAEVNYQAQVTQCKNQNETRKAVLEGWHFILGAELSDPDNNPRETAMSESILPWFDEVYAERDCTDLTKEYNIPPIPELPKDYKRYGPPLPNSGG